MAKPSHLALLLQYLLLVCLVAAYTSLSDKTLHSLPAPGDDFDIKNGKLLSPILRTRVPGTPGSIYVQNHFLNYFKTHLPKWRIEIQNSTSKTPTSGGKEIPFVNLVIIRDPPWTTPGFSGRLTLAAHYDSKLTPTGFIGAIDSAAPCAMIMHAARSIDAALTSKWEKMQADGLDLEYEDQQGIQIFFLDGEEAFMSWSDQDSLYGARSLAAEMESTVYAAQSTFHNAISSITLFVLLDLLGSSNPNIQSFYKTTHWAYLKMASLEKRLRDLSLFKSASGKLSRRDDSRFLRDFEKKESSTWLGGAVGDDHLPFVARGVHALHLIDTPFPRVWHTIDDDGEHLDLDTVTDWSTLLTAFVAEWMDLEEFMDNKTVNTKSKRAFELPGMETVTSKTEL